MKLILSIAAVLFTTQLIAAPTSLESCLKQKDSLDREYCQKKRLRSINRSFEKDFNSHKAGYSQAEKNKVISNVAAKIALKKALIEQLQKELKVSHSNLARVKAHLSHEERAALKKNKKRARRKEKKKKLKKLFKKIF
ncbi:MAG: hypothetical protein ACJAT2_000937 [Bacteriovoracaceae bacterium]|jgi:hypothetical protein